MLVLPPVGGIMMVMLNGQMVQAEGEWRQRIDELKELTQRLEAELVEAEAALTELLASLNAFEFRLRAGIGHLIRRLDGLTAEIEGLRHQLRHSYYDELGDFRPGAWAYQTVEDAYNEPGIDYDAYRYHEPLPAAPAAPPAGSQREELKKLYRQLARRFHPDLGANASDSEYRTRMMMAINAAYAAGDLARLQALAQEPDLGGLPAPAGDGEQMVAFLLNELARLQRRLAEIQQEAAAVRKKKSHKLMQQAQKAEASGRDWLAEMKEQLLEEIRQKMVERDVLQQALETQGSEDREEDDLPGSAFADAIWDFSLDTAFDMDPDIEAEDWVSRRKRERFRDDDDPDEMLDYDWG